jgi:uncharacterized protein with HEPN domain
MPERIPALIIEDILQCISHIQTFTSGITFEEFANNFMINEACLYNIQVIGEAVVKLPDAIKDAETQIPWKLMKGMRNRLIHEYFGADLAVVWNVITKELPAIAITLEQIRIKLEQSKDSNSS